MSVEIIIDNFLGRQVVWTIAAEAVQRLRPKTDVLKVVQNQRHTDMRIGCAALPSGSEYSVPDSERSSARNT
jgi:hypothetical protein